MITKSSGYSRSSTRMWEFRIETGMRVPVYSHSKVNHRNTFYLDENIEKIYNKVSYESTQHMKLHPAEDHMLNLQGCCRSSILIFFKLFNWYSITLF